MATVGVGSEGNSVRNEYGDHDDETVDDEAGHCEQHQALPGGFEANREEADEEHDSADKRHENGHFDYLHVLLVRGLLSILERVKSAVFTHYTFSRFLVPPLGGLVIFSLYILLLLLLLLLKVCKCVIVVY